MFKPIIRKVLRTAGYEIHRNPIGNSFGDAFYIQKKLLATAHPSTIFDVGAHHGKTAMRYAFTFPGATVYCFEPFLKSFEILKTVALSCKSIRPYHFGIADSSGRRSFYINQMSATNSFLPRPRNLKRYYPHNAETVGQVEVETTTLDTFCKQSAISKIEILKMDIQGGELLALQGATDLLSESLIDLIYTEVIFVPHYEGGPLFHELSGFLARYDYSLFDLFLIKHGNNGQLRYGDAIFISHKIRAVIVDSFNPEP